MTAAEPRIVSIDHLLSLDDPLLAVIRIEHLGDIIACEPIVNYLTAMNPGKKLIWAAKERYFEALWHPKLSYLLAVQTLVEARRMEERLNRAGAASVNLHFNGQRCLDTGEHVANKNDPSISWKNYFQYGGLLTAFCRAAFLPPLSGRPRFYRREGLTEPVCEKPYVVFHSTSNDSRKNWRDEKWTELADFMFSQGLSVVEVGERRTAAREGHPLYHDWTGFRSIQALAALIWEADFFFGLDSGFAHLANALQKDGLVIMGHLGHYSAHQPFTGMYAEDASIIVRNQDGPAEDVSVHEVTQRYIAKKNRPAAL